MDQENSAPPNENNINEAPSAEVTPEVKKEKRRSTATKIFWGIIILLIAAGTIFLGWWWYTQTVKEAPPEVKEPIVIGGISPLTGDASVYGIPLQQTAFLAQKEINESGGIDGRQIRLVWGDGKCQPEDATAAAQKLILEEKVDLLLGGICSDEFLASAPIAQENGILAFSPSATNPDVSKLGKNVFRTCPSDALAGKVAAQYAYTEMKARTAAVIAENKTYTVSLSEVFTANFEELGGKVLISEIFDSGTTEFTSFVQEMITKKPDVVYILPQTPTPGVLIVEGLKNAGSTTKLLTAEVLLLRDALLEHSKILEGVTAIEALFDETAAKTQHMLNLYVSEFGLEPTYPIYMAGMYDIFYLIKEAYENTDDSADAVANYLYNLESWEGAVGRLGFDSNGDPQIGYSIKLISGQTASQVDVFIPTD